MGTVPPLTRADIALQVALLCDQLGIEIDTAALARAGQEPVHVRQPDAGRATLTPELEQAPRRELH